MPRKKENEQNTKITGDQDVSNKQQTEQVKAAGSTSSAQNTQSNVKSEKVIPDNLFSDDMINLLGSVTWGDGEVRVDVKVEKDDNGTVTDRKIIVSAPKNKANEYAPDGLESTDVLDILNKIYLYRDYADKLYAKYDPEDKGRKIVCPKTFNLDINQFITDNTDPAYDSDIHDNNTCGQILLSDIPYLSIVEQVRLLEDDDPAIDIGKVMVNAVVGGTEQSDDYIIKWQFVNDTSVSTYTIDPDTLSITITKKKAAYLEEIASSSITISNIKDIANGFVIYQDNVPNASLKDSMHIRKYADWWSQASIGDIGLTVKCVSDQFNIVYTTTSGIGECVAQGSTQYAGIVTMLNLAEINDQVHVATVSITKYDDSIPPVEYVETNDARKHKILYKFIDKDTTADVSSDQSKKVITMKANIRDDLTTRLYNLSKNVQDKIETVRVYADGYDSNSAEMVYAMYSTHDDNIDDAFLKFDEIAPPSFMSRTPPDCNDIERLVWRKQIEHININRKAGSYDVLYTIATYTDSGIDYVYKLKLEKAGNTKVFEYYQEVIHSNRLYDDVNTVMMYPKYSIAVISGTRYEITMYRLDRGVDDPLSKITAEVLQDMVEDARVYTFGSSKLVTSDGKNSPTAPTSHGISLNTKGPDLDGVNRYAKIIKGSTTGLTTNDFELHNGLLTDTSNQIIDLVNRAPDVDNVNDPSHQKYTEYVHIASALVTTVTYKVFVRFAKNDRNYSAVTNNTLTKESDTLYHVYLTIYESYKSITSKALTELINRVGLYYAEDVDVNGDPIDVLTPFLSRIDDRFRFVCSDDTMFLKDTIVTSDCSVTVPPVPTTSPVVAPTRMLYGDRINQLEAGAWLSVANVRTVAVDTTHSSHDQVYKIRIGAVDPDSTSTNPYMAIDNTDNLIIIPKDYRETYDLEGMARFVGRVLVYLDDNIPSDQGLGVELVKDEESMMDGSVASSDIGMRLGIINGSSHLDSANSIRDIFKRIDVAVPPTPEYPITGEVDDLKLLARVNHLEDWYDSIDVGQINIAGNDYEIEFKFAEMA